MQLRAYESYYRGLEVVESPRERPQARRGPVVEAERRGNDLLVPSSPSAAFIIGVYARFCLGIVQLALPRHFRLWLASLAPFKSILPRNLRSCQERRASTIAKRPSRTLAMKPSLSPNQQMMLTR